MTLFLNIILFDKNLREQIKNQQTKSINNNYKHLLINH